MGLVLAAQSAAAQTQPAKPATPTAAKPAPAKPGTATPAKPAATPAKPAAPGAAAAKPAAAKPGAAAAKPLAPGGGQPVQLATFGDWGALRVRHRQGQGLLRAGAAQGAACPRR